MTEVNYQVRSGKLEDSKRVWEIRNNFLTRQNSNEQSVIPFENHQPWFIKKYFSYKDNKLVIIETNGQVAGYLRFDSEEGKGYVVSIALDPVWQGKGLGSVLLTDGLRLIKTDQLIMAQVKKFNPASLKLFQKCGFQIVREDENSHYLSYVK
ncbi:MAG: GNAT family N-acetyltransferase [Candidatus Komeilibacteria bacterium]|nr:GNAT family N-acetyltransferase [Candidatus Komeilibacteria bacterium]